MLGVRHFCPLMRQQLDEMDWAKLKSYTKTQGFVDQYGVFMDRKEALAVATAAGQINTRRSKTFPDTELFSEDLY